MLSKTIKATLATALIATGAAFAAPSLMAQDELVAKKMENVDYYNMTMVRYHAGKSRRAFDMIKDHFMPAFKKAELEGPWIMHFQTGRWDAVLFWDMKDGPAGMAWQMSPNGVKFQTAFREQEGGKDKVKALFDEYSALVAESDSMIGHNHQAEEAE